jgi:hypothetical protein
MASKIIVAERVLFVQSGFPATFAVAVTTNVPGTLLVSVGVDDVVLLRVPPVVDHEMVAPALTAPSSKMVPPTLTSDGLAESAVTIPQLGPVPMTITEASALIKAPPVPASGWIVPPSTSCVHTKLTDAVLVVAAATEKLAEPAQTSPALSVAVSAMLYPAPTGRPPTTKAIAGLLLTSTEFTRGAESNAELEIVYCIVEIVSPGWSVNDSPIDPASLEVRATGATPSGAEAVRLEHAATQRSSGVTNLRAHILTASPNRRSENQAAKQTGRNDTFTVGASTGHRVNSANSPRQL